MDIEIVCPFCGFSKTMPREKIPGNAARATCPRCRQRFEIPPPGETYEGIAPEPISDSYYSGSQWKGYEETGRREGSPWENRSEVGLWKAIIGTFKQVLFSPQAFFRKVSMTGGIGESLAFGLLVGSIGGMFGFFWQFLLMSAGAGNMGSDFFSKFTMGTLFLVPIVFVPVLVLLGMFLYTAILHVLLTITRGGSSGFGGTFRVIAYSQSAQLLGIVPFLGGWIGGIWQLIIQIIGLREIHGTTYFRVIIAFLIPVVILVLVVIAAFIPFFLYIAR